MRRLEACSPDLRLELSARGERKGWTAWNNQSEVYEIGRETYARNSRSGVRWSWSKRRSESSQHGHISCSSCFSCCKKVCFSN